MKQTVSVYQFRDTFLQSSERKNQFSYNALTALYDYLTDCEESCDMEIEFDMVGICCEFTEYDNVQDAYEVYNMDSTLNLEDDEDEMREFLTNHTTLIESNGGVIIADF